MPGEWHPALVPPRSIEFLVFPGVQTLDVVGPYEVFDIASRVVAHRSGERAYDVRIVAESGRAVTSGSGVSILPHGSLSRRRPVDTLVVAGGSGSRAASRNEELVDWVKTTAARARRVASVCTGVFLLAAAGLATGRRVTTHWGAVEELRTCFPSLDIDPDPIFLRDGKVWTSAGITAGMDLALALVEDDLGRDVALRRIQGGTRADAGRVRRAGPCGKRSQAAGDDEAVRRRGGEPRWLRDAGNDAPRLRAPHAGRARGLSRALSRAWRKGERKWK
jgi:transcriptional regulator GlxA family with amidase domain